MAEAKALSLGERQRMIRSAFHQEFEGNDFYPDVLDIYDNYLIACIYEDDLGYFRVAFVEEPEGITFTVREEWEPVEKEWIARKALDDGELLVYQGGAVKALGDGRVGGYLVTFGDATKTDLHGEYFTPETDFGVEWDTGGKSSIYFEHAFDPVLGDRMLGQVDLKKDNFGIWAEGVLERRDRYENFIHDLVVAEKAGWSSGTAPHLVRRERGDKATWIKRWPLGLDASITVEPADFRNQAVSIKSFGADYKSVFEDIGKDDHEAQPPEALDGAVRADHTPDSHEEVEKTEVTPIPMEVNDMTDTTDQAPPAEGIEARFDALEANQDQFSKSMERLMEIVENAPALKDAGYTTDMGGTADPDHVSFGDFCMAVKRHDVKRLTEVYQTGPRGASTKDLATTDGSSGGFLVPKQFNDTLLEMATQQSQILARVQSQPVDGSAAGMWPALDNYVTPTAGSGETYEAAGLKATARAEGATLTETEPGFVEIEYKVKQVGGYTEVNNEVLRYSPVAIEGLLTRLFGIAVASKKEMMILRGNGATQYLGILTATGVSIGIAPDTDNTFAYADMLEMSSRFLPLGPNPVWLMHRSLIPDVGQWEIGTNGAGLPQGVGMPSQMTTMPGSNIPIIYSQHLPQANSSGCAILADLSAYIVFQDGPLEIAFSEHAGFTSNKATWRFIDYSDGMPWQKAYVTLADPGGSYTASPFVYLND